MKKKFRFVALLLALCLAFTAAGCTNSSPGGAQTSPQSSGSSEQTTPDDGQVYEISFACGVSESDPWAVGTNEFFEALEERSGGRFQCTAYWNGELSSVDRELFEMVRTGTITYGIFPAYEFFNQSSDLGKWQFFSLPYLFDSRDSYHKLADSEFMQEYFFSTTKDELGVYTYPGFMIGFTQLGTPKKAVHNMADMQGMKIRTLVSEGFVETLSAWDAAPTSFQWTEVYTALQQNALDGVVTHSKIMVIQSLYDALEYVTVLDSQIMDENMVFNAEFVDSLPEDLRTILEEEIANYAVRMRELEGEMYDSAMETLAQECEVIVPTEEDMAELIEVARNYVYDKEKDVIGPELLQAGLDELGIDYTVN